MRQIIVMGLIFGAVLNTSAQIVAIPDPNFKAALIAHTSPVIDTNGDGEVQETEAEIVAQVLVGFNEISNLTGIEAFTALRILDCRNNLIEDLSLTSNPLLEELSAQSNALGTVNLGANTGLLDLNVSENLLAVLDLSQNTNLEVLRCNSNFLTSLDVSSAAGLQQVSASFNSLSSLVLGNQPMLNFVTARTNMLTTLDVSNCPALGALSVQFNELESLDTSQNPALRIYRCHGNELASIDVSANLNLQSFKAYLNPLENLNLKNGANATLFEVEVNLNPDLACIQVDDAVMANAGDGVYGDWLKDETAFYSEDCSLAISSFDTAEILVYPNPVVENFRITSERLVSEVTVYTMGGRSIYHESINAFQKELNPSQWTTGIYLLKISGVDWERTFQIIKE